MPRILTLVIISLLHHFFHFDHQVLEHLHPAIIIGATVGSVFHNTSYDHPVPFGNRVHSTIHHTPNVLVHDRVAIDFIGFCKSQRISVPDDLSVISIDDSTLAEMCDIPLTSVRHPQQLLGEKTAQLVIDLIKNPIRKVEDYYFNPEITVRDSVKEYK